MKEPRAKSRLFIDAYLRRVRAGGGFVTIARKGDEDAGQILIKLFVSPQKTQVYRERFGFTGARQFVAVFEDPVPESEADAALSKEAGFDSDVWVIEVEHQKGVHFLDESSG